ncbi:MAG: hypothetical protein ACTHLL_07210 [Candidatus Nitrosocosmicus sp.]
MFTVWLLEFPKLEDKRDSTPGEQLPEGMLLLQIAPEREPKNIMQR